MPRILLIPESLELLDLTPLLCELRILLFSELIRVAYLLLILIEASDPPFFLTRQVIFSLLKKPHNVTFHLKGEFCVQL